jgi:hypothetical protein
MKSRVSTNLAALPVLLLLAAIVWVKHSGAPTTEGQPEASSRIAREVEGRPESSSAVSGLSSPRNAQAGEEGGAPEPPPAPTEEVHAGKWVGAWYVFPIGPCTMITKLGGSYWFTLPHDETRYHSEDVDSAREAASTACEGWYANEMAGRLAVQRANEELARRHPRPQPLDWNKPLFTREGTLVCPSWEALEYAATSKLDGWKRTNYLLGVKDPIPQGQGPHVGEPVSAEYYGCSIYKDGVPVQMKAMSWTGVGPETSIGWLDPRELRN